MIIEIFCFIGGTFTIVNNIHVYYMRKRTIELEKKIKEIQEKLFVYNKKYNEIQKLKEDLYALYYYKYNKLQNELYYTINITDSE